MELQVGKTVGMAARGTCRTLIIYQCTFGDQGVYVCDAHETQTLASLKVQGEGWAEWENRARCKDLLVSSVPHQDTCPLVLTPSYTQQTRGGGGQLCVSECGMVSLLATGRNVQILRPLEDVEVTEKESATFSCEVSHDEVLTQWFRKGSKLRPSDNVRIRQEGVRAATGCGRASPSPPDTSLGAEWSVSPGRIYTLIYRRVLVEDAGEIRFVAENAESRAQLRVRGEGLQGRA